MAIEQTSADVSAALAGVRRKARHLAQAEGSWSWTEFVHAAVPASLAVYMIFSHADESTWSASTLGLLLLVSVIAGWQHRRLKARVDALTKLLTEVGYPGEA